MTGGRGSGGSARLRLTPLLATEAMYLLGQSSLGRVVCATPHSQTRTVGFHAVVHSELIILTLLTPELETAMEDERPIAYQVDSVDDATQAGWQTIVTGPARFIVDPALRRHYRLTLHGFVAGPGSRVLRLRPQGIEGHRFQQLRAAS